MPQGNWVTWNNKPPQPALLDAAQAAGLDALNCAAVVLRGAPNEDAWFCDPVTGEAFCAENSRFWIRREELAQLLPPKGMGTAAAADLCMQLRLCGKQVLYFPASLDADFPDALVDPAERLADNLLLRIKYGAHSDIRDGILWILKALLHPSVYHAGRGRLLSLCLRRSVRAASLLAARAGKNRRFRNTKRDWCGIDFGFRRGQYRSSKSAEQPLVSLIVRTRNRPETLRKTLQSLRLQTYPNFEIVLVEDGEPNAREMVQTDFADLPIRYTATVQNIGRAAAFNLGLSLAQGSYINMLDDDDFLAPEHLELGVAKALETGADMVFLRAAALETEQLSETSYTFKIHALRMLDFPRIDPFVMVRRCVTTNHGLLFKKSLCEQVGGMRQELGAHEDWNLWLRMMANGSWALVPYATNYYVVPFDKQQEQARQEKYAAFNDLLLEDEKLVFSTTRQQLASYEASVYHDYAYLQQLGLLPEQLRQEAAEAAQFLEKEREAALSFDALRGADTVSLSGKQLKALYCTLILQMQRWEREGTLQEKLRSFVREHPLGS